MQRGDQKKRNKLALRAANATKPRVYTLTSDTNPRTADSAMRFFVIGCHGDAKKAQLKVAALMNKIAADPQNLPDFILFLGDNFYDDGVKTPDDHIFKTHFYDIYSNPAFEALQRIPCFVILGNHDENLHNLSTGEKGISIGMHQVAHTYLPLTENQTTQLLFQLYNQNELNLDTLPKWNMPSRFYALVLGNTQLFCIDSNTYVSDFLKVCSGDTDPYNQANWFCLELKKAKDAGRKILVALHHPIVTQCRRRFQDDTHLYLSSAEKSSAVFKKFFSSIMEKSTASYNELIRETFTLQNLLPLFDAIFVAHDHNMSYYNNKQIIQIGAGGGGGKLQHREDFSEQAHTAYFLERHGFIDVSSLSGRPISLILNSVPKPKSDYSFTLFFNTDSIKPICFFPQGMTQEEQDDISEFYAVVMSAINDYLKFLAYRQAETNGGFLGKTPWSGNLSHGNEGVERVHTIWGYINNYKISNYRNIIETIYNLSCWTGTFTNPSKHSFITILNDKIAKHYGPRNTMESLYQATQRNEKNWLRLSTS